MLRAWLQRDPEMRFRQAKDRSSGAEALKSNLIDIAKAMASPFKLSDADLEKCDGKVERAMDQMVDGISVRPG